VSPTSQRSEQGDHTSQQDDGFAVSLPAVNSPKGRRAVRSIGEKFAANPAAGRSTLHSAAAN
jgi:hypothetical protein